MERVVPHLVLQHVQFLVDQYVLVDVVETVVLLVVVDVLVDALDVLETVKQDALVHAIIHVQVVEQIAQDLAEFYALPLAALDVPGNVALGVLESAPVVALHVQLDVLDLATQVAV